MTNESVDKFKHEMANSRYLSFSLGVEEYAVPLLSVKEVIAVPEFTPIPYTPSHFLGIMNLRGQVISVIDLRAKFNIKPTQSEETSVIICDLAPLVLGVVVDSVNSVLSPKPEDISPKPDIESNRNTEFITAVYRREKHLVLVLDIQKTLTNEDRNAMNKGVKKAA